jgi:hypothetical protein
MAGGFAAKWRRRAQVVEALFLLHLCRLLLGCLGYHRLRRFLPNGTRMAPETITFEVTRAIVRAARIAPRSLCLAQALSGQMMLARRGFAAHIRVGVRQAAPDQLAAHAWLMSGDTVILGGTLQELEIYTKLIDLGPRPLA